MRYFDISTISCVSSTFCASVSTYESDNTPLTGSLSLWNGSKWTAQPIADFGAVSVSCTSATFCLATSDQINSGWAVWNGSSWTVQNQNPQIYDMGPVSCVSSTFCQAVDGSVVSRYNGSAWTKSSLPGATSVSCVTTNFCVAAGTNAQSNGISYKIQRHLMGCRNGRSGRRHNLLPNGNFLPWCSRRKDRHFQWNCLVPAPQPSCRGKPGRLPPHAPPRPSVSRPGVTSRRVSMARPGLPRNRFPRIHSGCRASVARTAGIALRPMNMMRCRSARRARRAPATTRLGFMMDPPKHGHRHLLCDSHLLLRRPVTRIRAGRVRQQGRGLG